MDIEFTGDNFVDSQMAAINYWNRAKKAAGYVYVNGFLTHPLDEAYCDKHNIRIQRDENHFITSISSTKE